MTKTGGLVDRADEIRRGLVGGLDSIVDDAMWWPSYVPYIRSRAAVHRDEVYANHETFD